MHWNDCAQKHSYLYGDWCNVAGVCHDFHRLFEHDPECVVEAISAVGDIVRGNHPPRHSVDYLNVGWILRWTVNGSIQAEAYHINLFVHAEADAVTGARVAPPGLHLLEAVDGQLLAHHAAPGRIQEVDCRFGVDGEVEEEWDELSVRQQSRLGWALGKLLNAHQREAN